MEFIINHQLDIIQGLFIVCFIIFIFLLMTSYLPKEKKKALIIFVFSTTFLLLSDRYASIFRNQPDSLAHILAPVFKYLVFFNILNVVYGFGEFMKCMYIENHPDRNAPRTFDFIKALIIIGHILLIVSQFTNLYYSFDSDNIYHREKYYFMCYVFPLLATILQYIVMVKEFRNTKKHIFIPLVLYFTLPVVASVIQLFIPGLSLVNMIIGGVVIILYAVTIYDANMQLEDKKKTEADLKLAKEIQQNEIPTNFPENKDFDLYASMKPAKEVGGDFYDYFLLDNNHLGIVIADVSGKGVPAALNMFKAKLLLKSTGINENNPAKILTATNDAFIDNNKLDMFVTMWFGILEISTGKLKFANAGHEDPIIGNEKGFNEYKTKHGLPIGALENYKYENNEITLEKGDKLFLYTDGVTDSVNRRMKTYDISNLLKVLNENKDKKVKEIIDMVKDDLENYTKGYNQFDDITMLCVELTNNKKSNHLKINKKFNADINEMQKVIEYFTESITNIVDIEKAKKYYVVIDEIFSNIVKYGFKDSKKGYVNIKLDVDLEKRNIKAIFEDNGIKFNPLDEKDPNIDLSAKERKEGGLGIYIVKKMMDKVSYEYKNNKNIFTIEKKY